MTLVLNRVLRDHIGDRTDYTVEPDPPFDPATAAWANELLKAKGLR